jgi:hypothetical protein
VFYQFMPGNRFLFLQKQGEKEGLATVLEKFIEIEMSSSGVKASRRGGKTSFQTFPQQENVAVASDMAGRLIVWCIFLLLNVVFRIVSPG